MFKERHNFVALYSELSLEDRKTLTRADYDAAAQQIHSGIDPQKVIDRMRGWAHDYRAEAHCEGMEATRFDADH